MTRIIRTDGKVLGSGTGRDLWVRNAQTQNMTPRTRRCAEQSQFARWRGKGTWTQGHKAEGQDRTPCLPNKANFGRPGRTLWTTSAVWERSYENAVRPAPPCKTKPISNGWAAGRRQGPRICGAGGLAAFVKAEGPDDGPARGRTHPAGDFVIGRYSVGQGIAFGGLVR
jgi:hypothetical protein